MRKIIIEKMFSVLFGRNGPKILKHLWSFWNEKIKLFYFLKTRGKTKKEIRDDGSDLAEIYSMAKNETHLLLLKLLVAVYGRMYKEMYFLFDSKLELMSITSDAEIVDGLWRLQNLCQNNNLREKKSARVFYQVSFRDAVCRLREFVQEGDVTYLDLKLGAEVISEICTVMGVAEDVCKLAFDVVAEEFIRLNKDKIRGGFTEEEIKLIWERIYEQERRGLKTD